MTKREALSLADLKPRSELISVNEDQSLRVRGISAEDIVVLLERFPPLKAVSIGREIDMQTLLKLGPEVIGALCAAATGELGNEKAEKQATKLPVETQFAIIEGMWRCTFSNGFGPFAAKVAGIARALSVEAGKAPATNLPKPSKALAEQPIPASGN